MKEKRVCLFCGQDSRVNTVCSGDTGGIHHMVSKSWRDSQIQAQNDLEDLAEAFEGEGIYDGD